MLIPVRCFSCNRVISSDYNAYKNLIKVLSKEEAFAEIGVRRYCCKRMLLSHKDFIDELIEHEVSDFDYVKVI